VNARTESLPRLPFKLDPLIAEAKRRTRRRRLIVALTLAVIVGGVVVATMALRSPSGSSTRFVKGISHPASAVASDCGRGVSGQSFRVFACMSAGARVGNPHAKELLVVRSDGSSVAYPAFRVGEFAEGDWEVVATYNIKLVRVTSRRLVPLLTSGELARALHIRSRAIMDIYKPRVGAHGDIYFVASVLRLSRRGCRNQLLERTTGGTIRQIRSSISRNNICR
jgi:hypothetical protein